MKKSDRQNHILELVQHASSEDGLSTKDLAENLHVSEATIRRDFQELADAGLLQRHYGGVQPVRQITTPIDQIGILLASRIDKYSDPFYNLVLEGADKTLSRLGYHVAYVKTFFDVPTAEDARELLDTFDIKGLIVLGTTSIPSMQFFREQFSPVVSVTDIFGTGGELIGFDGEGGMRKMVKHLHSLGYRKPAYISGFQDDRYRGFIKGLESCGMTNDASLHITLKNWNPTDGEDGAQQLMSQDNKPDVIVCASDRLAIGALQWLYQNGYRVPDDIAVTGFDNIPDGDFTFPPLTTVNVHKMLLGQIAAERIIRYIENPDEVNLTITTPTELVIRQSCGTKPIP